MNFIVHVPVLSCEIVDDSKTQKGALLDSLKEILISDKLRAEQNLRLRYNQLER